MQVHIHTDRPNNKSIVVAYILLVLLGGIGLHRFYLGRPLSAILLALITISGFFLGFPFIVTGLWLILDIFLIPGMARR